MNDVSDVRDTLAALDRRLGEIRQHMVTILEEVAAHTGGPESEATAQSQTPDSSVPPVAERTPDIAAPPLAEPRPETQFSAPPVAALPHEPAVSPPVESHVTETDLSEPAVQAPATETDLSEPAVQAPEPEAELPEPSIEQEASPAQGGPSPSIADNGLAPEDQPLEPDPASDVQRLQQLRERLLESAREIDALRRMATDARSSRVVFEGEVTLVVRGIDRLHTLVELEEALQGNSGIERASVSGYVPGEARIHLTLARPMELAAELERALPFPHTLRASSCIEVVVGLVGPERLDP
jgi:hypothetical protein